jgi:hypothetical protein
LFTLVSLFLLAFGLLYASVSDMLWFHAAAVPEAVRPQVRPLYFALMRLIGGASIGLGLLALWVVWRPVRSGVAGSAAALSVAIIVPLVFAGVVAERLAAQTGAPTAATNMIILGALTLAGLFADWKGRRKA